MPILDKIYADIAPLKSTDKLILVDKILASIYPANIGVETIWGNESEERVLAYNKENILAIDAEDVLNKYSK